VLGRTRISRHQERKKAHSERERERDLMGWAGEVRALLILTGPG